MIRLLALCLMAFSVVGAEPQLVVLPFQDVSNHSAAPELVTILQDLMIVRLSRTTKLAVLDRDKLNLLLKERQLNWSGFSNAKTATANAKLLGANFVVMGSFTMNGDQLRVSARAVNVDTATIITAHEVTAPVGKLIEMGDQLGAELVMGLHLKAGQLPALPADEAPSANLCFVRGVAAFLTGQYNTALVQFFKTRQFNSQNLEVALWIGRCYFEQKQYAHAVWAFDQFLKQAPAGAQVESAQRWQAQCWEHLTPDEKGFIEALHSKSDGK